jgi:type IV secretion system protein VirB2
MKNALKNQPTAVTNNFSRKEKILGYTAQGLILVVMLLPPFANAQVADGSALFGGLTNILKSVVNLVVYEWGYYIGIITLAIQGYRWKTGRIDLMQLGGWGFGIALVFFAPNLVSSIRSAAGGTV